MSEASHPALNSSSRAPLSEAWALFSRHWEARWVLVILATTRMIQGVVFISIANAGEGGLTPTVIVATALGEAVYALCLAWLGMVVLSGPHRTDSGRWSLWGLMVLAYSAGTLLLGWAGGMFTAYVIIPAFPDAGTIAVVANGIVTTLPSAILLLPIVARLLLQAGGPRIPGSAH